VRRRFEAGRPSPASLQAVAEAAAAVQGEGEEVRDWFAGYVQTHAERLAFDLDEVRGLFPAPADILELGSTPPVLTLALARCGYRVTGIDIAPERFAGSIERLGLSILRCNLEAEPLPCADASFDGVICNEIFEHLRGDLIGIFEEIRRVLRPGGRLILTTPNIRSVEGLLRFLLAGRSISCGGGIYDEYRKLHTLGHMGHVREYTLREVREFLQAMGFTVEQIVHRGRYAGWRHLIETAAPRLRPFMQFVARRPAGREAG
jgi:SAM-dependent methyltransferase